MQKGNREYIENKLEDHFAKVRRVVDESESEAREKLEEVIEEQNVKLVKV